MKKNFILHLFIGGLCILLPTPHSIHAQKKDGIERSAFWGNSEKYLNRQAFKMFDLSHGSGKPTCFLLRTTKGLGVSYMENAVDWHGKAPNDEEYAQAMTELRAAHATLEKEIEFNNG